MTSSSDVCERPEQDKIVAASESVVVTGSNGFIGARVVARLVEYGFTSIRCLVRPSSDIRKLQAVLGRSPNAAEIISGNLQSRDDCQKLVAGAALVYHLAAGRGEKSYPDAFANSVVTTRNLLDAAVGSGCLKRFVNVSSFSVYSNANLPPGALLDESCEVDETPWLNGDPYCYAKSRQEEMVAEYGRKRGVPYVVLRPGVVFGPGNGGIHARVGIATFGIFLHLGGPNKIPLTYVDNCADAIVLAGLKRGIDGEVFNVVDDDLPTSRQFLGIYKKNVRNFKSVYLPHAVSRVLCHFWGIYSDWSGQLPPVFNRKMWSPMWKGNEYSNVRLKRMVGWRPRVGFEEAVRSYCEDEKARLRRDHA